jgi:DNA-binding IclR family transcriptional regulator
MPTSFLRGLKLLETIDVHGPLTVTELARMTGRDKSVVSRMMSACERDGWVVREQGRVALGPRAALLAYNSASGALIRAAEPLVEALAGVTGFTAQVYELVGMRATVVAAAGGSSQQGVGMSTSLVATAAGQAIAAWLEADELERLLPADPFPDPLQELLSNPGYKAFATGKFAPAAAVGESPSSVPTNRAELMAVLADVRERGYAIDRGDLHPQIGCVAVPWTSAHGHAALVCMGPPADVVASVDRLQRVLQVAAAAGATREDVVAAAAIRR